MPLFSVIIPAYNRADLIGRTIESALAQSLTDFEIIVVDDGSTDSTLEALRPFESRITILKQDNQGPGAARNHGIKHATGRYVAFLDSDDLWFPWTLATYEAVVRRVGEPAVIAGKPLLFHSESELSDTITCEPSIEQFKNYYHSGDQWRWWGVSSFVIRADALRNVGGFSERKINSEDADLMMRLGMQSGFVQIREPYTFGYRHHEQSLMSNFGRSVDGISHMISSEASGLYPGGAEMAAMRARILTRHIRPVCLECFKRGDQARGWELYRRSFGWQRKSGRWKFLLGAPLVAAKAFFKTRQLTKRA